MMAPAETSGASQIARYRDCASAGPPALIAAILGWSPLKRGVLRLGVRVVYLIERTWTWRRMVRLAPPERPNALGPTRARATAGATS